MANEKRIFGVGKARMGAVGAALTDMANGIGDVQSLSVDIAYQKKELMNSPEISEFPVYVCYYGGKVEVKINFANLDRNVMGYVTGAASSTTGGNTILTITSTSTPGYFRVELQCQDVSGGEVLIVLPNASAPGLNLAFALDDYTKSELTISGYPDNTNTVITISTVS